MEIDIVAESIDGEALLPGEAKWGATTGEAHRAGLIEESARLPFTQGKQVIAACWAGKNSGGKEDKGTITPSQVLAVLR
jgi:hypothetical protein